MRAWLTLIPPAPSPPPPAPRVSKPCGAEGLRDGDPVHQEMPLGCIDIAFRQGMPPGCIDIASTTQSVLEASIYAIDRGHRVAEKGATAAVRKKTRKKQPPPPPTRSCSVPSWWTREVTKQVPLGTNRIFHATSHDSEETRTSWVIGRVWPKHVAEARPSTMNNIVDHERQVAYAKIDPDWQRVLALTLSAQKSGAGQEVGHCLQLRDQRTRP